MERPKGYIDGKHARPLAVYEDSEFITLVDYNANDDGSVQIVRKFKRDERDKVREFFAQGQYRPDEESKVAFQWIAQ